MRLCLISVEIFAWGKYGGFGRATRTIGRELVSRGHEVYAVVPRRPGQGPVEILDGITVLSFPPNRPLAASRLLRQADADVYHSCEPSFTTWLASMLLPQRAHMVTCRDPRDWEDWKIEFAMPSRSRLRVASNFLFENGPWVRRAVQRADAVYAAADCLIPKSAAVYGLRVPPRFLPTPIPVPEPTRKASVPTVCFVGRLDRRKRPELFLQLAEQFPMVRFIAAGASNDVAWDTALHRRYGGVRNLEMRGFVDQFSGVELQEILSQSWIVVNTSAREGLPNSMLEGAAHGCAILSSVDPDGFATHFGKHVTDDDFAAGLRHLLTADRWQQLGAAAAQYVERRFGTAMAVDEHIAAYEALLSRDPGVADESQLQAMPEDSPLAAPRA
jgi:glycosyltransferase involved in cell wall biosynthesis